MKFRTAPIGALFDVKNGATPQSTNESFWNGEIPWITPADLGKTKGATIKFGEKFITSAGLESCGTQLVDTGSVIISIRAPIGHLAIAEREMCFNQGCRGLTPRRAIETRFAFWALTNAVPELQRAGQGTTFMELGRNKLRGIHIPLPDLPTQTRIAEFLDRETARIDALIAKKERLIAALTDKLRVAITKSVTQGFKAGADTKESGIDWIGRIPAHWRVMKLGYLGRCANGINIGGEAFGSGHPFISYGDVYKNRVLPLTISGLVQSTASDRSTYSVKAGDVLFTRTSETIEEVGFSSVCMETVENAVFAGFLIRFRPSRGKLHPLFSKFAFQHSGLRHYFAKEMNLITRASLSQDLLRNLPVALPPLEEQAEIGRELEKLEASISTITNKTKITVATLKERRAALITAAVTGHIDVSDHGMSTRAAETAERFVKEVTE